MERVLTYIIEEKHNNLTIKTYLGEVKDISSALITKLKAYDDGITVNGKHQNVKYRLSEGDLLKITMREGKSENIVAVKQDFEIVFEDEDIMIVNKPAGMPTHPSVGNFDNTLANGVMYYFRQKGEERVFRAVNRLDKDTSGLMCIAKNAYAHSVLSEQIKNNILRREYIALVCGVIDESGTVDAPIARCGEGIIKRKVDEDGQRAVTHYEVINKYKNHTLLKLRLETGRTHQIRVHMSYIGHPLAGDWLYGTEIEEIGRYILHSAYIELTHPVTGKKLSFSDYENKSIKKMIDIIGKKY